MKENLREFYRYRGLLYMIVYRDIKIRYKQSIMGFLWAILMPVLVVMSGIMVRYGYAMASHTPLKTEDLASVAVKSVPWSFLVASIRFSATACPITAAWLPKSIFRKRFFRLPR